jgi:hypothetical protein
MVLRVGVGAVVVTLTGHPQDAVTTAITTTVVMVVPGLSLHDAWQQPILPLVVGVLVGLAAAAGLRSFTLAKHRSTP